MTIGCCFKALRCCIQVLGSLFELSVVVVQTGEALEESQVVNLSLAYRPIHWWRVLLPAVVRFRRYIDKKVEIKFQAVAVMSVSRTAIRLLLVLELGNLRYSS